MVPDPSLHSNASEFFHFWGMRMSYFIWGIVVFIFFGLICNLLESGGKRCTTSDAGEDDDDDYNKRIQEEIDEDHLYRLWQDSDY